MISNNLQKGRDARTWKPVTNALAANAANMFVIADLAGWDPEIMMIQSGTLRYMLNMQNDGASLTLPATAIAGTFGAGACGVYHSNAATGTATAGTTSTITTNLTINRDLSGYAVRITAGTNAGQERIIKSNTLGANCVITVTDNFASAIDNTSVYLLKTGRYYIFHPGAGAVGFSYYDRATDAFTARSVTNIATTFATDGQLVAPYGDRTDNDVSPTAGLPVTSATATTITTGQNFVTNQLANRMLYIISGTGVGQYSRIASNTATVITLTDSLSPVPDSTSKYKIEGFTSGKATSATGTTIVQSTKTWTASQWINYQVRIVSGLGAGQVRVITANDATSLTVATWTINPDSTSYYVIEGDDDALYLLGNAAVTLYKYSISGNSWASLSPGVARAAAPGAGFSANWICANTHTDWTNENAIINGRRIYSFRGGAGAVLDYYDIPSNAWTNGVTYANATETYTTGTSWETDKGMIYCQQNTTGKVFRFDPARGIQEPVSYLIYPQGAATIGNKTWMWFFVNGDTVIKYLYMWGNTMQNIWRIQIL